MKKRNIFVPLIALSLFSNSYPMLQQHVAQAEEPQQEVPQREIKPLALLTARALVNHRPWFSWSNSAEKAFSQPIDHLCRGAIAVESSSPELAFNALLTSRCDNPQTEVRNWAEPYTPRLIKIVVDDILSKIKRYPALLLKRGNLCNAMLPKITIPNIDEEQKNHLLNMLAMLLTQSQEFVRAQHTYFPHIQIQPGQLNLEQTLLLLLIQPSQNQLVPAVVQFNANNILTQKAFKTLPEELQDTLRTRFTPLRIEHLTRRNLELITILDAAIMFWKKPSRLTFPVPGVKESDLAAIESITREELQKSLQEDLLHTHRRSSTRPISFLPTPSIHEVPEEVRNDIRNQMTMNAISKVFLFLNMKGLWWLTSNQLSLFHPHIQPELHELGLAKELNEICQQIIVSQGISLLQKITGGLGGEHLYLYTDMFRFTWLRLHSIIKPLAAIIDRGRQLNNRMTRIETLLSPSHYIQSALSFLARKEAEFEARQR